MRLLGVGVCVCVCVCEREGLNVFGWMYSLVGLKVCLCMSPSLMHGQCVYLVLFYHNVIITDTCKKCKLQIVEFELFFSMSCTLFHCT